MVFLGTVGALFVALAGPIVSVFTRDPAVAPIAELCLRTISYGFLFYAYGMVITQSFNGAGDTWTPTWINLGCFWLWEIPLAYQLARHGGLGPRGVALAVTIAFSTVARPRCARDQANGAPCVVGAHLMEAKELLDSLDVGVLAMAPDWTVAEWSAAAARITALPADRVLGRSIWVAFPAAKGTELERVFGDVLADGRPRTFLAPAGAPDAPGTVLETRVTRGAADHLAVAFRPVHEELAPESRAAQLLSALEAERRLYLQLFSSLPTPALVLTPDGQILGTNSEGAKPLGGRDAAALRGPAP